MSKIITFDQSIIVISKITYIEIDERIMYIFFDNGKHAATEFDTKEECLQAFEMLTNRLCE